MLAVLSPAKTLREAPFEKDLALSEPLFEKQAVSLSKLLKRKSAKSLSKLMSISDNLAQENFERYQNWSPEPSKEDLYPAVWLFNGEVYRGLEVETLSEDSLNYLQAHVRILSGLYGWLRPLDQIQPYRLEMGTKLHVKKNVENLYKFWGDKIRKQAEKEARELNGPLVNLASNEYFKAIGTRYLKAPFIDVDFKEERNGKLQTVSFFAKEARGMMARFMAEEKIEKAEYLCAFETGGYRFRKDLSSSEYLLFTRKS